MARTRAFPETYKVGLPQAMRRAGYEDAVIFGSAMMHYSIDKAVDVLGFGAAAVRKIPTDEAFRIDISALKAAVAALPPRTKVVAVVGVAGTTEAGSVDNLEALASIACDCGAHFHVSGKRFSSSRIYFEELTCGQAVFSRPWQGPRCIESEDI